MKLKTIRSLSDIRLSFFRVLPAYLNDMFGSHNISVCYGFILTAWSTAAIVGGFVFTRVFDYQVEAGSGLPTDPLPYITNSYWILCFTTFGLLATSIVRPDLKDRLLPPVEGQWLRIRFCKSVVVVKRVGSCPEIEIISSKKYDEMWDEYLKHRNAVNNTELTDAV